MHPTIIFIINSILLGVGLAMDAFSVSMANGLKMPHMSRGWKIFIPGTFAGFQFLMPMAGWICVHTIITIFQSLQVYIPWIALILLLYIGGKMLLEGIRGDVSEEETAVGTGEVLVQGVATSIDALSVGFTIASYNAGMAFACSLIIAAVTFVICAAGIRIGQRLGMRLAGKASILGGLILIAIGIEICFF